MTLWEYLDRASERRAKVAIERPVNARLLANVIGTSLVFGFIGAIVVLYWVPVPEANKALLTYMLGQLSGFAGGVVAYHYTMSATQNNLDAKRADTLGKMAEAVRATQTNTADEAGKAAETVADAAVDAADTIKAAGS